MTISSSIRKAGPYVGTGSQTVFPFAFKVFSASDLYVVKYDTATKAETVLTRTTHYTVSVNADQDNNPGGSVTLLSALASGYTLTLTSKLDYLQLTDLTNQGGFYPEVITTALDRATVQIQQLAEQVDRCAKVQISSSTSADVLTAATLAVANDLKNIDTVIGNLGKIDTVSGNISKVNTVAGSIAGVNTVAGDLTNVDTVAGSIAGVNTVAGSIVNVNTVADNVADVTNFADVYYGPAAANPSTRKDGSALQYGDLYYNTGERLVYVYGSIGWLPAQTPTPVTVTTQIFSGTGSQTAFTLSSAPVFLNALDVHISGVNQVPGVDYTLSGMSLSFTTAPPLGTGNILCRWIPPYAFAPGEVESALGPRIGSSGPASYRNKLGNCSFLVNQMGTSFTLQPGDLLLATSDLWGVQNTTDKPIVVFISSDSWMSWEGRKINLIYFTAQAQPTSGAVIMFQRIEGCNTLAGKAACLSYLSASPATGVPISASWSQNFGSGGSSPVNGPFSTAKVPTDGLARYSATTNIASTSGKTIAAGNYLQITLAMPIRSTNPIFIGLPQLEEGTTPTPIEFVEDWVDKARCQRRYYAFSGVALVGSTDSASSTLRLLTIPFPVPMRAVPTITTTGNYTWSSQGGLSSFVQLVCSTGNTSSQATLASLIADARL